MTEPRARARPRGTTYFTSSDLDELLYAFGDHSPSLPSTITTLDDILIDFLIETCHSAALSASYSRRQKIKVDDFKWVLRRDEVLLGRVLEQMWKEKGLKDERRTFDSDKLGAEGAADLADLAVVGGAGKEMVRKKGRRRKRRVEDGVEGAAAGGERKRQKSED